MIVGRDDERDDHLEWILLQDVNPGSSRHDAREVAIAPELAHDRRIIASEIEVSNDQRLEVIGNASSDNAYSKRASRAVASRSYLSHMERAPLEDTQVFPFAHAPPPKALPALERLLQIKLPDGNQKLRDPISHAALLRAHTRACPPADVHSLAHHFTAVSIPPWFDTHVLIFGSYYSAFSASIPP
jgi:hypothetical protein